MIVPYGKVSTFLYPKIKLFYVDLFVTDFNEYMAQKYSDLEDARENIIEDLASCVRDWDNLQAEDLEILEFDWSWYQKQTGLDTKTVERIKEVGVLTEYSKENAFGLVAFSYPFRKWVFNKVNGKSSRGSFQI